MSKEPEPTSEPQVTFSSGRKTDGSDGKKADLRLLHYNDVYHVDESSAEPVGGFARFMTLCMEYREGKRAEGQAELLTFFSGDAFNPSLESSVTKGKHMVPVLNAIGTDCACVGNHDFDFGVKQFEHLTGKCDFPWLLANVLDPALGDNVPLGNAKPTHMMTTSSGIKVGLIGLGEREWLETINSLPPNIIYKSATATAKEIVPQLREQGADVVICLSHMREPNDIKLAEQTDGLMDAILGGHDHYYSHSFVKGTHVLRSGTDFKNLSYIEVRRNEGDEKKWDFDIWRRDATSSVAEHEPSMKLAQELTSRLQKSLSHPIGWSAMPMDGRFSTVRLKESNLGNFVCDIMRQYHHADCTIMAAGTIRGDQVYPPGAIRIKDIVTCFPFEDPVVLLRAKGQAIWDALENGVSTYPAQEGRFPQVSGISFTFDPKRERGKRLLELHIGGAVYEPERKYVLATRGYMGRGKDGYMSLLVESEGGEVEELIDEESGVLISTMLRQYFMALRTVGQWQKLSQHWVNIAEKVHTTHSAENIVASQNESSSSSSEEGVEQQTKHDESPKSTWRRFLDRRAGRDTTPQDDNGDDDEENPRVRASAKNCSIDKDSGSGEGEGTGVGGDPDCEMDLEVLLMRKFWSRWAQKAGVVSKMGDAKPGECVVDWTRVIAPVLEGRIKIVGA